MRPTSIYTIGLLLLTARAGLPQNAPPQNAPDPNAANRLQPQPAPPPPVQPRHKRIFGIIPNYRTYPVQQQYTPLSNREKFKITAQDAFDPGSFFLAGAIAGIALAANDEPTFGHGVAGYARYYGTSYGDLMIGDFMTSAIFPSLLHQDPRYFRLGTGSTRSRVWHAVRQIFWTRTDSGGHQFNYSEIGGNATAAAISNAYYPSNRTAGDTFSRFGVQVGLDMAGNILKEFWPDVDRKFWRKPKNVGP
jgi:hypothetical protein